MHDSALLIGRRPREAHGAGHGHGEVLLHCLLQSPCVKQSHPSLAVVRGRSQQTQCAAFRQAAVCFAARCWGVGCNSKPLLPNSARNPV